MATFATGGASAFVARGLGAGLTLLLYFLVARVAGEVEYGHYIYVYSWATILTMVATLGLDLAALRFVAAYVATGEWAKLKGFVVRVPLLVAGVAVGLAAIVSAGAYAFESVLPARLVATLYAGCVLLPLMTLVQLFAFMIRGQKRALASFVPQALGRPLLLITVLGAAALWPPMAAISAARVMAWDVAATGVVLVASAITFHRAYPRAARASPTESALPDWMNAALPLAVVSAVRLSMNKIDILMLGIFIDTTAAGIYALASQMSMLVAFPLLASNSIAAPLFSEHKSRGEQRELQRLVTFATRSVSVAAALIAVIVWLGAPWILPLFGNNFGDAYLPLIVLTLAQLVNAASGAVGFLLGMSGQERAAARLTVSAGLLNLLLNAAMIPLFGLLGAAAATAISGIAWNLLLVRRVRTSLGIRPTVLG